MSENRNNAAAWWKGLLGIEPKITAGETSQIAPGSDEQKYLESQERQDAMRLIELGNRTNDPQAKRIGQARLRVLEGKPTPEDLELLEKK